MRGLIRAGDPVAVSLLLMLAACQNGHANRVGRPGDPGYVGTDALGASRAHAGAIDGEYEGATFHVAYYEQAHAAPLIGLEYGAYDATSGHWLHVSLWAQGELPHEIDLASYRAVGPDGELEPAQVEYAAPDIAPQAGGVPARLQRARAGRLVLDDDDGHIALALTDLAFEDTHAAEPAPDSGRAEGDVAYECWRFNPAPAATAPRAVGRHLFALPNPGERPARYVEDRELSSDFCKEVVP
jgi:hypothetical protein